MKRHASSVLSRSVLIVVGVLLGSIRAVQAQPADLIIATNAEITFPACTEQMTYFYLFTVVDDGGGISTPTISNLGYSFTGPNQIDVYDSEPFTYATYEMAVTVPSPPSPATNDCFTITYEGESVSPCFDVVAPGAESCISQELVPACAKKNNGMVRIVQPGVACRNDEYPLELVIATPDDGTLEALEAPVVSDDPDERRIEE